MDASAQRVDRSRDVRSTVHLHSEAVAQYPVRQTRDIQRSKRRIGRTTRHPHLRPGCSIGTPVALPHSSVRCHRYLYHPNAALWQTVDKTMHYRRHHVASFSRSPLEIQHRIAGTPGIEILMLSLRAIEIERAHFLLDCSCIKP